MFGEPQVDLGSFAKGERKEKIEEETARKQKPRQQFQCSMQWKEEEINEANGILYISQLSHQHLGAHLNFFPNPEHCLGSLKLKIKKDNFTCITH